MDCMVQHNPYSSNRRPEHMIVNECLPSMGISAHIENFRFDEPVCGLTLGDGDYLCFYELSEEDDGSVRGGEAKQARQRGKKVAVCLRWRGDKGAGSDLWSSNQA
jgi:hypothetical protein